MKEYFIKINLKSLRRNPDFNPDHFKQVIPGFQEWRFSCTELPSFLVNEKNCFITTWKEKEGKMYDIEGHLLTPLSAKEFDKEEAKKTNLIMEYITNMIDVTSKDAGPKYLFRYIKTKVRCKKCKEKFDHSQLKYDEIDECPYCGSGYSYTYTKCPICGEWDCCKIKYEKPEEAILRTKRNI